MNEDVYRIELIYDAGCPNVAQARSLLSRALAQAGVQTRWREWERSAPDSPDYARHYGSPTILVDGRDVAGAAPVAGTGACRLYADGHGALCGTPPLDAVCAALLDSHGGRAEDRDAQPGREGRSLRTSGIASRVSRSG